jgi:hypothetical protein
MVQSSIQFGVPGHSSLTQREKQRSTSQTQAPGPGCPPFVRHGQLAVGVAVVVSLGSAGTASIVPRKASRQVATQTRITQPPSGTLPQDAADEQPFAPRNADDACSQQRCWSLTCGGRGRPRGRAHGHRHVVDCEMHSLRRAIWERSARQRWRRCRAGRGAIAAERRDGRGALHEIDIQAALDASGRGRQGL